MIEARKTSKGFKVINLTLPQIQKLGATAPICDNCNTPLLEGGIYVGALGNRCLCEKCFQDWHAKATYYPEDSDYETRVTERTLTMLNNLQ